MDTYSAHTGQQHSSQPKNEIVFILSLEGTIIYAPAAAASLTGYHETALVGLNFPNAFIAAADRFIYNAWAAESRDSRNPKKMDTALRILTSDGGQLDCHCRFYKPGNNHDIICANVSTAELLEPTPIWPLRVALDCSLYIQQAVTEKTLPGIFAAVSKFVSSGLFDAAWISPIAGKKQNLVFPEDKDNEPNWHPDVKRLQRLAVGRGHIVTGPAPGTLATSGNGQQGSLACIPLISENKLKGLLNLYKTESDFFTEEAAKACESIAGQIVFALALLDASRADKRITQKLRPEVIQPVHSQHTSKTGSFNMNFITGSETWSEEALHIYGLPAGENHISYKDWLAFVHPEDLNAVKNLPYYKSGHYDPSLTFRIIRADGKIIHIAIYYEYEFDENGKAVALSGTLHNVTDEKNAMIALQHSEQNLHQIIDSIPQLIFGLDDRGYFTFANESFGQFYGKKHSELIGQHVVAVLKDPIEREKILSQSEEHPAPGCSIVRELSLTDVSNNPHLFSVVNIPFGNNTDVSRAFLSVAYDITGQQSGDTARLKLMDNIMSYNKHMEQFSYIVSHNLRAPVANIIGLLEELRSDNHDLSTRQILVNQLTFSAQILDQVTIDMNTILEIKNSSLNNLEVIRFNEITHNIQSALNDLIIAEDVQIQTDFSAVPEMVGLKGYLYDIFQNLISNSIKYRDTNVKPKIRIATKMQGSNVVITYADNGIGINLDRSGQDVFGLYKRFHTHKSGKGLGLFIVKTQTEAMGGTIAIESAVGKGTTFQIRIPQEERMA